VLELLGIDLKLRPLGKVDDRELAEINPANLLWTYSHSSDAFGVVSRNWIDASSWIDPSDFAFEPGNQRTPLGQCLIVDGKSLSDCGEPVALNAERLGKELGLRMRKRSVVDCDFIDADFGVVLATDFEPRGSAKPVVGTDGLYPGAAVVDREAVFRFVPVILRSNWISHSTFTTSWQENTSAALTRSRALFSRVSRTCSPRWITRSSRCW